MASQYPNIWTDEGQYLSEAVGKSLTQGLAEVSRRRPRDPISTLALSLYSSYLEPAPGALMQIEDDSPSFQGPQPPRRDSLETSDSSIAMQTAFNSPRGSASSTTSASNTSPHVRDVSGRNALHVAAAFPHAPGIFAQLVHAGGVTMIAERDVHYHTPRDVAEMNGQETNVKELDSVVCSLAAEGNVQDLRYLMMEGYNHLVDAEDLNGRNIYKVAEKRGQKRAAELLQEASEQEERRDWLNKAINVGSLSHTQYITDTEDLALGKDDKGRTALHHATLLERKEIMEYIASKYPNSLSIGDNLGRTALHYAMGVDDVDSIAKVLVQAGAKRSIKDLRGKLPSYYFMHRQDIVDMIKEIYNEEES